MRFRLRLHVRTNWMPYSERWQVLYCLTGISHDRPTLRTTWDTHLPSVYYAAQRVARGDYVTEVIPGFRNGGQVTTLPVY